MMDWQTAMTLRTEAEQLHLAAPEVQRAAAAKEREYQAAARAAALEWYQEYRAAKKRGNRMSDKETVEQLRNEIDRLLNRYTDDMGIIHNILDIDAVEIDQYPWPAVAAIRKLHTELAHARTEAIRLGTTLADAYARRIYEDETAKELTATKVELTQLRKLWLNPAGAAQLRRQLAEISEELARVRADLADSVQGLWLNPAEAAQLRAELKDLRGANKVLGKNRDYWYDKTIATETALANARKKAQVQSDEVQRDWLSPCQKVGLERLVKSLRALLKHTEGERDYWLREHDELEMALATGRDAVAKATEAVRRAAATQAAIVEAAVALTTRLRGRLQYKAELNTLEETLMHKGKAAAKLLERLATLDAAEKALANCGIGGIYAEFDTPADAIAQMEDHIKELTQGSEDEQAHWLSPRQRRGLDEALQAERQLRQEAEHEIRQRQRQINLLMDAKKMGAKLWLEEKQRAERAEALAQLVNEETAALLERLANDAEYISTFSHPYRCTSMLDADETHALAAKIREALDDGQA